MYHSFEQGSVESPDEYFNVSSLSHCFEQDPLEGLVPVDKTLLGALPPVDMTLLGALALADKTPAPWLLSVILCS